MKSHFEQMNWQCVLSNTDSLFLIPPNGDLSAQNEPVEYVNKNFKNLRLKIEDEYESIAIRGHGYIYFSKSGESGCKQIKKMSNLELKMLREYIKNPDSYNYIQILENDLQQSARKNKLQMKNACENVADFITASEVKTFDEIEGMHRLRLVGPKIDKIVGFETPTKMIEWIQTKCDFSAYSVHESFK